LMLTPGRAVSGRTAPRYVTRPTVRGVGPSPPLANFFGTRADVVCATAAAATLRGRDAEGAAAAAAARRGFQTAPPRCSPVLGRGRVSRRWRPRWGARQPRACGCRICGGRSAVCRRHHALQVPLHGRPVAGTVAGGVRLGVCGTWVGQWSRVKGGGDATAHGCGGAAASAGAEWCGFLRGNGGNGGDCARVGGGIGQCGREGRVSSAGCVGGAGGSCGVATHAGDAGRLD